MVHCWGCGDKMGDGGVRLICLPLDLPAKEELAPPEPSTCTPSRSASTPFIPLLGILSAVARPSAPMTSRALSLRRCLHRSATVPHASRCTTRPGGPLCVPAPGTGARLSSTCLRHTFVNIWVNRCLVTAECACREAWSDVWSSGMQANAARGVTSRVVMNCLL
jgi:hypothetical protein